MMGAHATGGCRAWRKRRCARSLSPPPRRPATARPSGLAARRFTRGILRSLEFEDEAEAAATKHGTMRLSRGYRRTVLLRDGDPSARRWLCHAVPPAWAGRRARPSLAAVVRPHGLQFIARRRDEHIAIPDIVRLFLSARAASDRLWRLSTIFGLASPGAVSGSPSRCGLCGTDSARSVARYRHAARRFHRPAGDAACARRPITRRGRAPLSGGFFALFQDCRSCR